MMFLDFRHEEQLEPFFALIQYHWCRSSVKGVQLRMKHPVISSLVKRQSNLQHGKTWKQTLSGHLCNVG